MYDPSTLAFSFPPYANAKDGAIKRGLYRLSPWIGLDIWHVDPERSSPGQRTDDSCGWFDRRPREYADAVAYLLNDKEFLHEVKRSIATRRSVVGPYGHEYPRMPLSETLAACLLVAQQLELRRWWNGASGNGGAHRSLLRRTFTRKRVVDQVAIDLALNPFDNLSTGDDPEELIRLIAAALHRRFKPWWRHPRWHVHHWQVNVSLFRNLRRMVQPCAGCGKRLGFGYSPVDIGDGKHRHHECAGVGMASARRA